MLSVYVESRDGLVPSIFECRDFAPPASGEPSDFEQSPDHEVICRWILSTAPVGREVRISYILPPAPDDASLLFLSEPRCHAVVLIRTEAGFEPPAPRRRCARCHERSRTTEGNFYRRGNGWSSWCKTCSREYAKAKRDLKKHGRRFGVEIEFVLGDDYEGPTESWVVTEALANAGIECIDDGYTHEVHEDAWKIVSDSSVECGWELVSPPLRWSQRDQITTVCDVLDELCAAVDSSCGLHVHHEVRDLTLASFKRLFRNWADWQHYTSSLVSPMRRDGQWCQNLSDRDVEAVESMTTLGSLSSCYLERYKSLNVTCYPSYGTVEIRQHQGSINARKIQAWIAYGQAVIEASTMPGSMYPSGISSFLDWLPFRDNGSRLYLKERAEMLAPEGAMAA